MKTRVRAAAKDLVDNNGCKAIAVSLLQSWANPAHERRILEILEEMYPNAELFFSVGSDLIQVSGEYARTNTAVINAYVGPIVKTYLDTLEEKLKDEGLAGAFLITQGNGGAVHKDHITPIGNFQSGPAGGMMASAYMADLLNHSNVITTDMGGTSFDVGMLTNGYWRYASEPVVERFRVLQPIIDIESIGGRWRNHRQGGQRDQPLARRPGERRRPPRPCRLRPGRRAGGNNRR